jgi:type IV pilus assembly protein PilQ
MTPRSILAGLLFWSSVAGAAPTQAADANVIRGIDAREAGGAAEVVIRGTRAPSYSVFRLQDPQRLVVDLAGADVSGVTAPAVAGLPGVAAVTTAQYRDDRSAVGRVIVTLDGTRRYEVAPRGDAVVVRVFASDATADAAAPVQDGAAPAPAVAELVQASAPSAAPAATPAPAQTAAATASDPEDRVVARRVDEAPRGSRPARAVTAVRPGVGQVVLATDGEVSRIDILELRDPPRLALDLYGITSAPKAARLLHGAFSQVRFGQAPGKVRVVFDAAGTLPACQVNRVKGGLAVVTEAVATAEPAKAAPVVVRAAPEPAAAPARPAAVEPAAAPAAKPALARISGVRFSGDAHDSRIEIDGRASYAVTRPDARTLVLTLENAELAHKLERSLDTAAFKGPVQLVSAFNQPTTGQVRIVVGVRGAAVDVLAESSRGLSWSFTEATGAEQAEARAEPPVRVTAPAAEAAGFAAEAPGYAASSAPQARGYTGRRITLDFHDIEIRNLLRLLADVSKKNIVVADDVTGRVTISLRNVPWDQALDLVLKAKGLGKEETGDVIRIARFDALAKEQTARAEAEKAKLPLIPLKVRIIPVNFARAAELATRIKDVLTERGTVSTDERTNVLIVKDIAEALARAEGLVRNLDTETPQVLIESRIVEASNNYNRALGVQWGGAAAKTQALGNPTGLVFPNNITAAGAAGNQPSDGTATAPGYAVNLPAAIGQGSGGGIGFTFGSVGGAFNLNLRLSALENSGMIKTVSAPRIATIDNKEATISQGISIPFSQTSASGVNTTFIEAKLELKVTPHVSADGSVLLKIHAANNAPNPQLTGANGQPSISKREAETEVLVKDGDTTVIGGIYTRQTSNQESSVPFLGKIPVLGYFFRSTTSQDDHTELLIFITPRILNRSATTAASAN